MYNGKYSSDGATGFLTTHACRQNCSQPDAEPLLYSIPPKLVKLLNPLRKYVSAIVILQAESITAGSVLRALRCWSKVLLLVVFALSLARFHFLPLRPASSPSSLYSRPYQYHHVLPRYQPTFTFFSNLAYHLFIARSLLKLPQSLTEAE